MLHSHLQIPFSHTHPTNPQIFQLSNKSCWISPPEKSSPLKVPLCKHRSDNRKSNRPLLKTWYTSELGRLVLPSFNRGVKTFFHHYNQNPTPFTHSPTYMNKVLDTIMWQEIHFCHERINLIIYGYHLNKNTIQVKPFQLKKI